MIPRGPNTPRWWEHSAFYEVYVRSFQDSNGDGVGDLGGVRARLPYLADLGIDAIWLTPFFSSPQVDFGYDISDYENVDPLFGTLDDFDRLVADAHRLGIRIVLDIVLNHTSDRHPWFESSRSSVHSPFRDWYIWREGRESGPPNNWQSTFGGPAWTYDERTGAWYYHCFYRQQPDLNWRNPAVEHRMLDVMKFWLDRGADGFRLDAINALFEDPDLRDNPPLPEPRTTLTGVDTQQFVHTRGRPEIHDLLKRIRGFVQRHSPDALLISEAYVDSVEDLAAFYGNGDEMHLPFNFFLAQATARDASVFRNTVSAVEQAFGGRWPSIVLGNHDIERLCDRFCGTADRDAVAKLLATVLLTLRGTPFLYYGDEIAMRTDPPATRDEVQDPVGRTFWPKYKGRDGERRPMQWDASPQAGFTTAIPWLRVSADYVDRNVLRQAADSHSVLNYYRQLLRLRRQSAALRAGTYCSIGDNPAVFAYLREASAELVLVVLNMSAQPQVVRADVLDREWQVVVGTYRPEGFTIPARRELAVRPLEALVLSEDGRPD